VFPALATAWQAARAPAQQTSLVVEAQWSHPLRLRFPLLPLRGRPLGPRLSRLLCSLKPGGRIRFAFVSRSCHYVAGRSGPGSADFSGRRSPVVASASPSFPALATTWQAARAPAQQTSLVVEAQWSHPLRLRFPLLATGRSGHNSAGMVRHGDQISPHLRSLWFPALGYGPLGPRLRNCLRRHRPDRAPFSERYFPRSCRHRPDSASSSKPPSQPRGR
jgi:hypothetical protein